MHLLELRNLPAFMSRFHGLADAIVVAVALHLPRERRGRSAEFRILVRDSCTDGQWVTLRLQVSGLSEYKLADGPEGSYQVLSDGLQVAWFGGTVLLDLGPYTEEPSGIEDRRRSGYYVAGDRCEWDVVESALASAVLDGEVLRGR